MNVFQLLYYYLFDKTKYQKHLEDEKLNLLYVFSGGVENLGNYYILFYENNYENNRNFKIINESVFKRSVKYRLRISFCNYWISTGDMNFIGFMDGSGEFLSCEEWYNYNYNTHKIPAIKPKKENKTYKNQLNNTNSNNNSNVIKPDIWNK